MVRAYNCRIGQAGDLSVPKHRKWCRILPTQLLSSRKVSLEGNQAQSDHDSNSLQMFEFLQQIRAAIDEFRGQRLIVRGSTVDCGGNVTVDQPKTVAAMGGR